MSNRTRAEVAPVAAPLLLSGAHAVLPLLRLPCDDAALARVPDWLDRRLAAAEPVGLEDELDELAVWLDLPDPLLAAARLAHLAATCLVDGPDEPDAHALALAGPAHRHAGRGPAGRARRAGARPRRGPAVRRRHGLGLPRAHRGSRPADRRRGRAPVAVAYVHGCFRVPELSPGCLLRDLAGAGPQAA